MSEEEKNHWENRYSDDGGEPHRNPSVLLTQWLDDRPPGKALDLACGMGRNSLFLAEKGYAVTAIDISPRAIKSAEEMARGKGLNINWIVADLDHYAIQGQYDLIVISFFRVSKNMVPSIINALKSCGILLSENHMLPPSAPEDEARRHRFHLKPGELGQLFAGLKVIRYEERQVDGEEGHPAYLASLVAQKELAPTLVTSSASS
jgi:tellurite methyltransferase